MHRGRPCADSMLPDALIASRELAAPPSAALEPTGGAGPPGVSPKARPPTRAQRLAALGEDRGHEFGDGRASCLRCQLRAPPDAAI